MSNAPAGLARAEEGACVDGEVERGEGRGEQRLVGGAELVAEHRGDARLDACRDGSETVQGRVCESTAEIARSTPPAPTAMSSSPSPNRNGI